MPGRAVQPVRVDGGNDVRRRPLGLVMVQHQHVGASAQPVQHRAGGGAAIHAHHQRRAAIPQAAQRRQVGAVAFGHAVGHVGQHRAAQAAQDGDHHRRAAGAVNIVVAEHRHALGAPHGRGEAGSGTIHVDEHRRIRQHGAQGRHQEIGRLVHPHAAHRQKPAQQLRHLQPLRDRQAEPLGVRRGRPPGPASSRQAGVDVQNRWDGQASPQVLVAKLWCASTKRTVPDLLRITTEWVVAPCP